MQIEDGFQRRRPRKVRVKVKTNRGLDFITAIRVDATISDLANRALGVYLQLSEDGRLPAIKKQLTVSAVKQGIFYMPKSELVANLLNNDDEVEVVIIKAKPKYPNQMYQNNQTLPQTVKPIIPRVDIQRLLEINKQITPVEIDQVIIEQEKQHLDNISCISKRQIKKQKKQEKQKLKQQAKQLKQGDTNKPIQKSDEKKKEVPKQFSLLQKSQTKNDILADTKPIKENESNADGNPRKRLKFDKQEVVEKPPLPPIIVPSPKITFHNEPRMQSPKFFLLSESSKKKGLEGQARKPSEDIEKKSQIQKMISPVFGSRSPLIYQRSPNTPLPETLKIKEKDQLSNFTLNFRKLSEDKKVQPKKEKPKDKDGIHSPRKEELKNSLKKDEEKQLMPIESEKPVDKVEPIIPQNKQVEKRDAPVVQKKIEPTKIKMTQSMIVVEQDDSDSEQNKKSNGPYVHHRQKELSQIQQKINEFYIDSQEE